MINAYARSEHKKNRKLKDFGFPSELLSRTQSVDDTGVKMATIREEAQNYVSPETKNISELDEVSTELETEDKEFTKEDGSTFKIKVAVIDGEEYRVPASVLKQLKEQLAEKPDSTKFKVRKKGEGMKTEYTVVMLD